MEVPFQAHHSKHFPNSCSMYVCTGDFKIRGLGSFLKSMLLSLGKYTPSRLFSGPLLILLLSVIANSLPAVLNFSMPTLKDKRHFCVRGPKSVLSFFQNSSLFSVMSGIFSSPLVPLSFHLSHHSLTVTHLHCQGRITPGQAIFSPASVVRRHHFSALFFYLFCFLAKHLYHLLSLLLGWLFHTH